MTTKTAKTTNVYVLELLDNCYYVGRSDCVEKRLMKHLQGKGCAWTKLHKPCGLIKVIEGVSHFEEDKQVKELMNTYGIDKVRGGSYVNIELSQKERDILQRELWMANDCCLKCGSTEHYVKFCNKKWYCDNCDQEFKDYDECATHEIMCTDNDEYDDEDSKEDIVNTLTDIIKESHKKLKKELKKELTDMISEIMHNNIVESISDTIKKNFKKHEKGIKEIVKTEFKTYNNSDENNDIINENIIDNNKQCNIESNIVQITNSSNETIDMNFNLCIIDNNDSDTEIVDWLYDNNINQ